MSQNKFTYERYGGTFHMSRLQPELIQQRLLKYQNKIFEKENQVDSIALQEYLHSVRASKIGKQRVFTQKTQISHVIENIFNLLKRMIIIPQNQNAFKKILSVYCEIIKSRENSRHNFGPIQEHLKQILNLEFHRKNTKIFDFISSVFDFNPYIVYKNLQSRPQFFEWNSAQSLKIYQLFIKYASDKKNITLILKQIKKCIQKQPQQLERLKILLTYLPSTTNQSLIMSIYNYINTLIDQNLRSQQKIFQICLLQTIKLFVSLPWPEDIPLKKNDAIIKYLNYDYWRMQTPQQKVQLLLNQILCKLEITNDVIEWLVQQVKRKIRQFDNQVKQQNQNFRTIKIIFSKLGRERIERFFTQQDIKKIIQKVLDFQLQKELVGLLGMIKSLQIYSLGNYITKNLQMKIQTILSKQPPAGSRQRPRSARQQFEDTIYYSKEDKQLAIKALRLFKFNNFDVYRILKHYVLKNEAIIQIQQIKRQVIKACLYSLTYNSGPIDKNKVMRQILNLINKDLQLKKITIEWFRDNELLYDKKIFEIFKEPQYLHVLFQDYASNHMVMKRFSIKVLCFIYPLDQCEIVPFLKRVYYHIYDRLSSENIVNIEQKKQALRLTRQILRHRTQIIYDDASALCNFLYNHLYRAKDYEQKQMNQILVELFKTIVDLILKIPKTVLPYAYPITEYIVKLLNSKDCQERVKNSALNCFNQMIRGCSYVLIPYFHFKNLFEIIRQTFKDGNRSIDHQQILRLLGNLGFLTKDKNDRLKALTFDVKNPKQINKYFQKIFKQTNYLKQIKNEKQIQVLQNSGWNGPYLFTKEQTTYTYIEIANFKKYILAKINKILSERPSKRVQYKVFKVLQSFIFILSKQQQKMYQNTILCEILKPEILKQSGSEFFSLVSKLIRFQDTKQNSNLFLDYLIQMFEDKKFTRKLQLIELIYIITSQYPQQSLKDDQIIRKIVSHLTEFLSKPGITANQIKISLKIIQNIAQSIDNLIHLFLPQFNKEFLTSKSQICLCYFQTILTLCQKAPSTQFYLPPITQSLILLLNSEINKNKQNKCKNSLFIQKIIDFALCLMLIYGDRFKGFITQFKGLVNEFEPRHLLFSIAQDYMKRHSTLNYLSDAFHNYQIQELFRKRVNLGIRKIKQVTFEKPQTSKKTFFNVIQQFSCDKNQIEDQSEQWFNKICINLFQKSTQISVHQCISLVKEDRGFCYDIFPVAFYFFWNSLCLQGQKKLTNKLKIILESKVISLSVKQKILDTIYFMAQWKISIPLKSKFLYEVSIAVLDSAKALFYMQSLFQNDPQTYGQPLIEMYAELEQKQSAIGLLKIVQNLNTRTKILLNKKLKRYHDALKQFDKLEQNIKPENFIMQITIRKQMSDWDTVMKLCNSNLFKNSIANRANLAPLAVEASINLGKWDQVRAWLPNIPQNHENLNLWKTMLKIKQKQYGDATKFIKQARIAMYPKISQLFNFSFERCMQGIVKLQQLCELEQATTYLQLEQASNQFDDIDKKPKLICAQHRKRLQNLWNDRIQGSKKSLNAMQLLLMTRNLLLSKTQDISNWIDYCHLALRQNQTQISRRTLKMLQEQLQQSNDQKKKFEIDSLMTETKFILGEYKDEQAVAEIESIIQMRGNSKSDQSICKLYYNCALWLSQKQYDFTIEKGNKCIQMLKKTTQKIKNYIKGWHLMGLMHLKIDELLKQKKRIQRRNNRINQQEDNDSSIVKQIRQTHIFQALHCFIKSVSCGLKNHGFFLQDCLKIMNILFNENEVIGLVQQLHKNYTDIPAEGLIDIIPQIIGRLDVVEKPKLLDMMKKLLVHIGQNHPQALVFYLVFLRRGKNETRKKIAEDIYKQVIKKESQTLSKENQILPTLYDDTQKIVTELCKVSLKLNEKFKIWMSKIHQQSKTVPAKIIAHKYLKLCLKFKNESIDHLSISQFGFLQQYKQEMADIISCLNLFLDFDQYQYFRKAERIIYRILNQLQSSLKSIKKISLEETSPLLGKMNNTRVCLPGSYNPSGSNVYISSFSNQLSVIDSKQRPKKLIIIGNDQKQHLYLLKGKQDLRLDERIMQLFNLINKMFHDPIQRQNYSIKGYSITPISLQTGIIQWVQNCDTIGTLIMDYRKQTLGSNKVFLEMQISSKICKDYKQLPKAHKVQIYKQIESRISGNDLKNVFWIRSSSSEEWLRNRSCYTRSLAVMSMVGFIIGLGDRHPHNIMIQRNTGKVVHIDFGDCFDVNKMRAQFPEKVPFRLTRMLVKNMEPCGTHGIFKHTCQKIIKMLRSNKQSIIAIIQAFKYDPIIGWRLKGGEDGRMLQNSYQNNQTEESYLEEEEEKKREKQKEGDSKTKINNLNKSSSVDFAQMILNEIKKKLGGKSTDDTNKVMSPQQQVNELIHEAMSPQNLVDHYEGWLIYW